MSVTIIILGVIFGALSLILIPYGFQRFNDEVENKKRIESKPNLNIKLAFENNKISIYIKTTQNLLEFGLDLPVVGKITDVVDNNSATDAILKSKKIVGANSKYSINNVELLLENVSTNYGLNYVIYYEPAKGIVGPDRYRIFYTWLFSGDTMREDKWLSIITGQVVGPPSVLIKGIELSTELKHEFPQKINKKELR